MPYWETETALSTEDVVARIRQGATANFNRLLHGKAEKATRWETIPPDDGGVFDSFDRQPEWAARVAFTPPNGHGGAYCDVKVFDNGASRRVTLNIGNSLGLGSHAKAMAKGIAIHLSR